jgi:N-formylglutamate amidohydrolase
VSDILLAVPHAGVQAPDEIRRALLPHVDAAFLRTQSDVDTELIYDDPTCRRLVFPWSRLVADPNRGPDQDTEGGVVPHRDFDDRPIYPDENRPGQAERFRRVVLYHTPYHVQLGEEARDPRTRFLFDCHSMSQSPPRRSLDFGRERPDAVLSNRGDRRGESLPDNGDGADVTRGGGALTCPPLLTRRIGEALARRLTEVAPEGPGRRPTGSVWLNEPFPGGYGVRAHANPERGLPALQIELNQGFWCDPDTFVSHPGRIEWMRGVFRRFLGDVRALRADWGAGRLR